MTWPHVSVEPGMRFGGPHIKGIPVESIAGSVWVGEDPRDDYGLTEAEVILACWFMATHGSPKWKRRWRDWLERVGVPLWRGNWDVPWPPSKDEPHHLAKTTGGTNG